MRADRSTILIFIIILFHVVGLAGFAVETLQPFFLQIVPFHLLLMLAVIFLSHQDIDPKFVLFIIIVPLLAFGVEWLGVHKHFLFGNYVYGQTLGYKWNGIPLIITVNWFLLVYATGTLMQNINVPGVFARITIGAFILTVLDVFIEPSATHFDYWHWTTPGEYLTAPLGNYISWFAVSAVMLGIFEACRFKRQNAVGAVLLLAQFVFFLLLYWI